MARKVGGDGEQKGDGSGRGTYLEGGKVDDAVNGRVRLEDGVKRRLVRHVGLVEEGPLAAEELDTVEGHDGRVVQAVDDNDVVPVLEEGERREGADVAGSSARGVSGAGARWGGRARTRLLGRCRRPWFRLEVVRGLRGRGGARVGWVVSQMGWIQCETTDQSSLMKVVQGDIKGGRPKI